MRLAAKWWTPEARMAALSFLVLYLELSLIRWVSGYVHNFGYFTNFAMLAAFLGVGVGCLLAKRARAIALLPCFLVALAVVVRLADVEVELPAVAPDSVFWSESIGTEHHISATSAVILLFVLITLVFVGIGQLLGALFAELPRLRAYGFNVVGGLAGILVFALNSHYAHPPLVWFATALVIAAPFLATTRRLLWPVNLVVVAIFLWMVGGPVRRETWGPYYRQTLITSHDGFLLAGNGIPGIDVADFDHLTNTPMYEVPYSDQMRALRKHPNAPIHRALVIGCGAGNDVAMALARGAEHVDAVDINPWVIEIGKEYHPLHPFASDKVTTYVADGREFLARAGEPYDVIVYGLPDSTFTNDRANLRVESFIFTTEAFRKVLSRLSKDGIFVIYNYYRAPWLVEKLRGMMRDASGQEPYMKRWTFPDGTPLPMVPAAIAVGPGLLLLPPMRPASDSSATDDWPFLYLTGRTIPVMYRQALAYVAILSLLVVAGALFFTRKDPHEDGPEGSGGEAESPLVLATLFFMGLAFVLLETRSVVTFGLFFGSTWWNNVVVFAAIHVSVLLAVLMNVRFPSAPRSVMAAALLGSLAFAWWLPPDLLLVGGTGARAVLAGTVAFLPIFCANVLFASIFRSTREGRVSYAFNLIGGILGGLLEYVSLLVGYQALIAFAAGFYVIALLLAFLYSTRRAASAAPA